MSVKGILKKKFKIKNPIDSLKKKKKKKKCIIPDSSFDTYHTFDPDRDNTTNECSMTDGVENKITSNETPVLGGNNLGINIDNNVTIDSSSSVKKKRKSIDNECLSTKKKTVTFAADVKSENDQKCTVGNMKPLSLNKRKKLNYIKKLKAKKNKQKNAKKLEENASNIIPRQEKAIKYLMQWKDDRSNWKFKKIYQLWLIKNTYDSINVPKEYFETLVEYLQTIEGKSRDIILQSANSIITEFSMANEQEELNSSQYNKYQRARTIIQTFS